MSNLLKMHLFRARRSKLTWILPIILAALLALEYGVIYLLNSLFTPAEIEIINDTGTNEIISSRNYFENVISMLQAQFIPMMLSMFLLMFLGIDRSTGFIKNIVSYMENKCHVAGANLLLALIYLTGLVVLSMLVCLGGCLLIYDRVTFDGIGGFLSFLLVFYLSTLFFVMLLIALADLSGKHVLVMILGVLFLVFGPILFNLINLLINYLTDSETFFVVQRYLPLSGLSELSIRSSFSDLARIGSIALALLIGSFALDVVVLKKQDIK